MAPNVSSCVRFTTLGAVDLRSPNGAAIPTILVQPKRLAVLARLAALPSGGYLRRDVLLVTLWPELDEARARNALNKAVHHIRQSIGEGVLVGRGDEELGLDPDHFCSDVQEFERAVSGREWTQVARLYRGDYLPGLHIPDASAFGEWLDQERARLRRLAAHAAGEAANRLAGEGAMAEATEAARRAVAWSGESEPAVRGLMALLNRQGDRAGALRAYDEFANRLQREFEVEPDAETKALRDNIVANASPNARTSPSQTTLPAEQARRASDDPAPEARPTPSPRPRFWLGLVLVAAALALALVGLLRSGKDRASTPPPSPHTLAILPFATTGSDTALVRLGRDLMVLVSARVNGIGDIEVIGPVAVLAQADAGAADGGELRLRTALQSLGATQILEGTLVRLGERVRVDAQLFQAGEGRSVARVELTGSPEEMVALADSVVLQLVGQLWPSGLPASAGPPALSTRSLPALRAFLDGERLLAEDRGDAASARYAAAIASDSTFWLAYWRYLYLEDNFGRNNYPVLAERLRQHRAELPEPERTLVEARFTDSLAVRGELYASAVARYPASWEAWYTYADHLYHWAPFLDGTYAEAHQALERTVGLNPGFADAWEHLLSVSLQQGDTVTAGRALMALERLRYDSTSTSSLGFDLLRLYRWYYTMLKSGGQSPPVLSDSIASAWLAYHGPIPVSAFDIGPLRFGLAAEQIEFGQRVLARSPSRPIAEGQMRGMALAWAARGAWDSALATADRYAAASSLPEGDFFRYRLAVIGAWLGAVPPAEAERRRAAVASTMADLTPDAGPEFAWLDGVLAAARGDVGGIERARGRLRSMPQPMEGWLDGSLAGLALDVQGAHTASVDMLARVEGERIDVQPYDQSNFRQPFLTAVNRMVLSRNLAALGDTVEAVRQLRWTEAFLQVSALEKARVVVEGLVYLERARLEAGSGQTALARRDYRQFLRWYDMPMPAHQQLVDDARAALAGLERVQE